MKQIKNLRLLLVCTIGVLLTFNAQAHRAWIVPSSTVLSGDDPWVTFDAAISNTLFFADHHPMNVGQLKVIAPNGEVVDIANSHAGKYRSTFDLQLVQPGSYRISMASSGLRARWEDADGKRHMWPQRGRSAPDSEFATAVPENAKNLKVEYSSRRIETFVTAGAPSKSVFEPTGTGLELVPVTHPNDLYAGEKAKFRLLMDGEPANGAEITVVAGGMRYRNTQEELTLQADSEGYFSVTWPNAGMYWLSASYRDDKAAAPATQRSGSYTVTLEVLPL